jgi:hypothetical protein
MARKLNPAKIVETLARLQSRIAERFPASGLAQVCAELVETGRATAATAQAIARPNFALRLGVAAIIALGVAAQVFAARFLKVEGLQTDAASLVQGLDAAVNLLLLAAGGVWFLLTLEERFKRRRRWPRCMSCAALLMSSICISSPKTQRFCSAPFTCAPKPARRAR